MLDNITRHFFKTLERHNLLKTCLHTTQSSLRWDISSLKQPSSFSQRHENAFACITSQVPSNTILQLYFNSGCITFQISFKATLHLFKWMHFHRLPKHSLHSSTSRGHSFLLAADPSALLSMSPYFCPETTAQPFDSYHQLLLEAKDKTPIPPQIGRDSKGIYFQPTLSSTHFSLFLQHFSLYLGAVCLTSSVASQRAVALSCSTLALFHS